MEQGEVSIGVAKLGILQTISKSLGEISGRNPNREEYLTPHWIDTVNNAANLRESWIKINGLALFIYGEFSGTSTIEKALQYNYNVGVVFGPKILPTRQGRLKELKEAYPNNFKLYSLPIRPEYHATLIDNNLFYEDHHKIGESYKYALVVENADKNEIENFKELFIDDVNQAVEITDIEKIPIYTPDDIKRSN